MNLPESLERRVVIAAPPAIVFAFFADAAYWARWWGAGSEIEARPGGRMKIRYPNGVEAHGEVVVCEPPSRIVFTYGYANGDPIPAGASRVTICLRELAGGETELTLTHEFAEASVRDLHVQGWRYQLSMFANAVSDLHFAGAESAADAWYALWTETDAARREAELARVALPGVTFRDRHSSLAGHADLAAHIAAALRYLPGGKLERQGPVRQCQGTMLANWVAKDASGNETMRGTSVFTLAPDRRIAAVASVAG